MNGLSDSNLDPLSISPVAVNDVILVFLLITLSIFSISSSVFIMPLNKCQTIKYI